MEAKKKNKLARVEAEYQMWQGRAMKGGGDTRQGANP